MTPEILQMFIPIAGLLAVGFAIFLARDVLSRDTGTKEMMEVSATINEGAVAFIKRQYMTIGGLAIVASVAIFAIISLLETKSVADTSHVGLDIGIRTGGAFLIGAACSMACGIIGMLVSVKANVRVASAARRSLVEAVQVAMRGGAVSGANVSVSGTQVATLSGGVFQNSYVTERAVDALRRGGFTVRIRTKIPGLART